MKFILKIFLAVTVLTLFISCNPPTYSGDMDLEEQQSVWQYLKVFSIYEERLPDKSGGRTPEELFDLIHDTLKGGRYTEYKSLQKTWGAAAAFQDEQDGNAIFKVTDSTAYLRISEFSDIALSFFKNGVPYLEQYAKIIIDLRGNRGGLVNVCEYIANELLPPNSEFIQYRYRVYDSGELKGKTVNWEKQRTTNRNPILIGKKIAILMDRYSASASEILISGLKDKAGAYLIGDTSYGKGIGQSVIARFGRTPLSITSMNIKGLTDRTGDYHRKGIAPDTKNQLLWDEAVTQYPFSPSKCNLYYAVKTLEPSAIPAQVVTAIDNNGEKLPQAASLAKTVPIGAYYILEDPLAD